MKERTDPKSLKTVAVLAAVDNTAACRTVDVLLRAAHCDGEDAKALTELADGLKKFISSHQPKPKTKDCAGQNNMLDGATCSA